MEDFKLVLLGTMLILLTYIGTMYACCMGSRIKVFTGAHMKKFKEIHQKEIKEEYAPQLGYPDTGSGRYSEQLSYKDWFIMNCGQRCQLNFLEQLPIILLCSVVAGMQDAQTTFYMQVAYAVARVIYAWGYMKSPKMRVPGAIIQDLALLGLLVNSYRAAYSLVQ